MVKEVKVAVLGAGVNGLTCALKIKERFKDLQVVVISKEFTPNTTGDGSGGSWYPYLCGDTPEHLLSKWGFETYRFLHKLWLDGTCGVCFMPIYLLYRNQVEHHAAEWTKQVFGYQTLDRSQLEYFSQKYSAKYYSGHTFLTFVVPPPKLLAYLQKRFIDAKGQLLKGDVTSLQDPVLQDFDVVVNCTGLGARFIVPDDRVTPIRGQIARVKAPWLTETIIDQSAGKYIIPNEDFCVLGGTGQNEYNTKVDPNDTISILNGCKAIIPGLEDAPIINQWVGLRPSRDSVRLEKEEKKGKLYIHNYGHGGSGITLFWGCGSDVLQILETHINKTNIIKMSKL